MKYFLNLLSPKKVGNFFELVGEIIATRCGGLHFKARR